MIKTAVVGASGYVGRRLLKAYREKHPDCVGTAFSRIQPGLTPFDIREPDLAALRLEETGHRALLIAAAQPSVHRCEEQKVATRDVNVKGTLELIRQAGRASLPVIFLSSDYVFSGPGPHDDGAAASPATEYGRQKALVEKEIPALAERYLILRLSKIFGLEKGDGTLLDDLARSLSEGREVLAAEDQLFCPTLVDDLSAAILAIQERGLNGTLNVSGPEIWSRYRLATETARALRADAARIKRISLHDLPSMAGRPLDTSMTCSRLGKETEASFTPIGACIERVAARWRGSN